MTSPQKQRALVIAIVAGAFALVVAAYVANGPERDDVWLYWMAGVLALLPLLTVLVKPKHKD